MIKSGIYAIQNLINNKIYVGSAIRLSYRWKNHKIELRLKRHINIYLQSAWDKYWEHQFEFKVLEYIEDISKLIEREQYWIDYYNSANREFGYNISPTAGSCLGVKHTEETKAKLSILRKGKSRSEEAKQAIKEGWKKRGPITKETKAKMRAAQLGKKHTEEFKKKMSERLKGNQFNTGRKQSTEHIATRLASISVPCSEEKKAKISASNKGKIISEESRAKMSAAAKSRWSKQS